MFRHLTSEKAIRFTFIVILLIGLYLRFYHYLMGRSLWEDETHLALNFMSRGFAGLAQPLDFIQGAPILFLWLVKTMVVIFGYGEIAFRAIPFISSVLTLPLIYFITLQLTKNRITALLAFLIFSVNLALIYFSSELKQYAVETAMYLLLVFLAVTENKLISDRRNLLLAVAGSISIFLSSTAFIVLFCIACHYFLNWYKQRTIKKEELMIFIPWAAAFLINYFLFIYDHPSVHQQRINYSFAFLPTEVLSYEFVDFLKNTIEQTFFTLLLYVSKDYGFSYILLFIFIVVIRHIIIHKQYPLFFFACLPILLHLALSAMELYPFWYRLILYLVPCFIILMSHGTVLTALFLKKKIHAVAGIAFVVYCAYFFTKESISQFPLWFREIKPSLTHVNNKTPEHANVYIFDPVNAYTYYFKRGYVERNIYKALPWEIDTQLYYDLVYEEDSNYVLFYKIPMHDGYKDVIGDLKSRNLIIETFEFKGYAVSEVKPLSRDSTLAAKIDHSYFDPSQIFEADKAVAIWEGSITSKPVFLKKGKYHISILSRGTPVQGEYPKHQFFINEKLIGEFTSNQDYEVAEFFFETDSDLEAVFKVTMLNDAFTEKEDRNSFIRSISVYKK